MGVFGKRNNHWVFDMPDPLKTDFRRWALLIFALLLLPFCSCIAGNPESIVNESTVDAVIEEKSPLDRSGAIHTVSEESIEGLDTTPLVAQIDQQAEIPTEWLEQAWNGFERSENCQVDNNNLPQINFTNSSICELQNFQLFFDRFSEDIDFQMSVAKFPLKLTMRIPPWEWTIDEYEQNGRVPEKIICLNSPKNSNTRQLFPIKKQRELGLERLNYSYTLEGSIATVSLTGYGNGIAIEFIFTWNRCWILSEIKDYST